MAVADLHVFQPVVFFRQGADGLGKQGDGGTFHGQFVRFGAEELARHPDQVAGIEFFEQRVGVFSEDFFGRVTLDAAAGVHEVKKGHLAERTQGNDAPGQGEGTGGFQGFGVHAFVFRHEVGRAVLFDESVGEESDARVHEFAGFHHPVFDHFIELIPLGQAFEHGHEPADLGRLGGQLDAPLLFVGGSGLVGKIGGRGQRLAPVPAACSDGAGYLHAAVFGIR